VLGFEVYSVYTPYTLATNQDQEGSFDHVLEPQVHFSSKRQPLIRYEGEVEFISTLLDEKGHSTFHPYLNWISGQDIRDEIQQSFPRILSKPYKKWREDAQVYEKKINDIFHSFREKYPETYVNLNFDDGEYHLSVKKAKDTPSYKLSPAEKKTIANGYEQEIILLVNHINKYMGSEEVLSLG